GDNHAHAEAVAREMGIGQVYAELLPQDKVNIVEKLLAKRNGKLAFVGDGINDAPVLARADIGIAMGGLGSDTAIEAADVVFMTDEIGKLAASIQLAKYTRKVLWQNIALALGIKALFLILGALGAASLWEAVFADVGVTLIAVINASRVLRAKV
ncbi:MAG: HAD-IC family P-type ATPase, partial [Limnochordia bacterium]